MGWWPPFAAKDSAATDPAALAKAKAAGYSEYEWTAFTPELRASFLSDPTFGKAPIVDPGQMQEDPAIVFRQTFFSGVFKDFGKLGDWVKKLGPFGVGGLAIGAVIVLWLYTGGKRRG